LQQNFKVDPYRRPRNFCDSETFVKGTAFAVNLAISITLLLVFGIRRRTDMFLHMREADFAAAGFTERHEFVILS
jgi:hypothetical protein